MNGERIESIDTVRGVAVLGILVMNIIGMAYAGASYLNPMLTGDGPLNLALWALSYVAIDGKMRALFSMLFGASMLLMAEASPPERQTRRHVARMLVLLLFGALHGSLLWPGDILLPFAVAGLLFWWARHLDADQLFLGGVLLLALQLAITLSFGFEAGAAEARALAAGASAEQIAAWDNLRSMLWSDAADMADETARMTGGLAEILAVRHQALLYSRLFLLPFHILAETGGLMLIGMALYRLHWWRGDFEAGHYRRLASLLVPAGLLLGAFLCWRFLLSGFSVVGYFYADAARLLVAPLLATGYAALVILLVKGGHARCTVARLAACGRMALSNYVAASLLGNLVFTGIGFGLYGRLDRWQVLLLVALIWALQLWWSRFWLRRYRYGPLEWLWRSLARARVQPWQPPAYTG